MDTTDNELYFDYDAMRWKSRPKGMHEEKQPRKSSTDTMDNVKEATSEGTKDSSTAVEADNELYFCYDDMRWKSRPNDRQETFHTETDFEMRKLQEEKTIHDKETEVEPEESLRSMVSRLFGGIANAIPFARYQRRLIRN